MAEKKKVTKVEPKPVKAEGDFKNVTSKNIFTTRGRCGGGATITLPVNEGESIKGLESV